MSTTAEAQTWAWRQKMPPSKASAKMLLVALANECFRDDGGPYRAAPGQSKLMEMTGMSAATVSRLLLWLADPANGGFIERMPDSQDAKGRLARGVFVLKVSVVSRVSQPISVEADCVEADCLNANSLESNRLSANWGDSRPPEPGSKRTDPSPDLTEQDTSEYVLKYLSTKDLKSFKDLKDLSPAKPKRDRRPPPSGDPSFDEFWSIYPRTNTGKATARIEWPKAVAAAGSADVILNGARRYRDDPNRPQMATEGRFIPHAKTWLHQQRWLDGPEPSRISARPTIDDNVRAGMELVKRLGEKSKGTTPTAQSWLPPQPLALEI